MTLQEEMRQEFETQALPILIPMMKAQVAQAGLPQEFVDSLEPYLKTLGEQIGVAFARGFQTGYEAAGENLKALARQFGSQRPFVEQLANLLVSTAASEAAK